MSKLLYILVFMMLLASCTGDKEVRAVLDRAEALMEAHPDSAYEELQSLLGNDSVSPSLGGVRGGPRTILLLAEAENKLDMPLPSDTVFQEVVDYYDRHGNANERMKAYYLMGCIYRDRHEAPMALQWYLDAVEQADTLAADCDYLTLMKVYGQMADIYHSQLMPSEEIEAYRHFSKCAEMMDSTYYAIRGIEKQLDAYSILGDTAMILALTDSVHDLYLQAGMPQAASSVYPAAIYIYLARHDYLKVKQLMDIFEHESGLFDTEGNISKGREHYYCAKGAYYKGINKLDSSEYYYRKLLSYHYAYDAYKGLLHLFELRHQSDSIIKYNPYFESAHNAQINNLRFESTQHVQLMYDYRRSQQIASQKEIETIKTRYTLYIILIIGIVLFLLLFWIYDTKRRSQEAEILQLKMELESVQEKIGITEEGLQLFKTNALQFEQHEEEKIRKLKKERTHLVTQLHGLDVKEDDTAMFQTVIYQRFKEKAASWNKTPKLTSNDWHVLHTEFQHHFPRLYKKFTYCKLTDKQIDIAMLVRLRFSSGDIQRIMDMEKQAVSNYKNRISQKLYNLDSSKKLFTYLTSFYLEEDSEHVKESSI